MDFKQILDFSEMMEDVSNRAAKLARQDAARKAAAQQTWQQQTDNLHAAVTRLETEYDDTESRRRGWANQYAERARQWLEDLNDPLWHAVKDNCFLQCTSPRAQLNGMNETQLLAYLLNNKDLEQ